MKGDSVVYESPFYYFCAWQATLEPFQFGVVYIAGSIQQSHAFWPKGTTEQCLFPVTLVYGLQSLDL